MPLLGLSSSQNESTCAIRCDGSVWCWGNNTWGQLGDGTLEARATPVAVRGLDGPATSIATGYHASCAVGAGGVRCWGGNAQGQLGDGTRTARPLPVAVAGLARPAVAVVNGGIHACALLDDGSAACWGDNGHGGLGDGTTGARAAPTAVRNLAAPVAELAAGQYHTCARLRDGSVQCWGFNELGAVGDGTTVDRGVPVTVSLPDAAVAIAATSNHTCAVLTGGELWCWGYNSDGAVSPTRVNQLRPVRVSLGGAAVRAVATGQRHTCALLDGGELRCWGMNGTGQLGDGSTVRRVSPVAVAGLDGEAARVSAGVAFTCAGLVDGRTRCWGGASQGQLGNGSLEDSLAPVTVTLPP